MSDIGYAVLDPVEGDSPQSIPPSLPAEFTELVELRDASIEHRLGYFRSERFVIFGYCPGGGEVIWKDGHCSGFGTGGWRVFLEELVPLAAKHRANLGSMESVGTHVLAIDRVERAIYMAPRETAEGFLAQVNGIALPKRRCLCALLDCASCPVRSCPMAGMAQRNATQINRRGGG